MTENKSLTLVRGIKCAGVCAGLKESGNDVALIVSEVPGNVAAVFTKNKIIAEPIKITKKHIRDGRAQAFVINSGNANACTGKEGTEAAIEMALYTGKLLKINMEDVIVASTGIIGEKFPLRKVKKGIKDASKALADCNVSDNNAAEAILTTDTVTKKVFRTIRFHNKTINIAGIAKGSGMIHPDMGTMLAFVVSDINIAQPLLEEWFKEAVDQSFNMITVDGDTSTNDMAVILCNGLANNEQVKDANDGLVPMFKQALNDVCVSLAKMIVADGEGVTKFIEYNVKSALDLDSARKIIRTISDSSLVKTAFFGNDPNWGRIIAAAGRAGVDIDINKLDLFIGEHCLLLKGTPQKYNTKAVKELLNHKEIYVTLDLNQGDFQLTGWGSDLSIEYVRFNAAYTT